MSARDASEWRRRPGETRRQREIRDYYLAVPDEEIRSSLAPVTLDLWAVLERHRAALGLDRRWLEVGGGRGDVAAEALRRGWDVTMTEVLPELAEAARQRHPALAGRVVALDVFDARAVRRLAAGGRFPVVSALSGVLNHARDRRALRRGLGHLVALATRPGLVVVDLMVREQFPGRPGAIWCDFLHVLAGLDDLGRAIARHGLQLLDAASLFHHYPATPTAAALDERMLRLVLQVGRPR